MKPLAEEIFLQEIARQIRYAQCAINRLKNAIDAGNGDVAYDEAEDFLNHAAIVSKFLNPSKNAGSNTTMRRQYLRNILNISESEPVLDRRLRNHLEHLDKRLDE